ncbi:MAG: YggT family protein [Candidatus Latescibacteria bacterium]|jgi:YggT family protein|nr:YggT family protein [Candidatus Latescibacterota bacterium]
MGLLDLAMRLYMLALGLRMILPTVTPFTDNPILRGMYQVTEPFLQFLRQYVPKSRQGLDWSPLVGILLVMIARGVLLSLAAGLPLSAGLIDSALEIEDFAVTALSVVFLGVFFISMGTPFGFSQIGQVMVNVTDPVLFPLRRFIGRASSGADIAALVAIVLVGLIDGLVQYQIQAMFGGQEVAADIGSYLVGGVANVLITLLDMLFYIIFARVILSWFSPDPSTPVFQLLIIYTDPILAPIQRIMPSTYGMDFSPIIAAMIIGFVRSNVVPLLMQL